jgi:hypothetical protein
MPKPALLNWAGEATAEYAVDNWDTAGPLSYSERLKKIKGGRYEKRDAAANKGTAVHAMAERLIAGEKVTVPDELTGYVQACVRFLDDFEVRAVHVEAVVYSETHRHVGTVDLIADVRLPDMPEYEHIGRDSDGYSRGLLDWKTSRSGIFGDVALQLVAYRHSEFLIDPDPTGEVCRCPRSTSRRHPPDGRTATASFRWRPARTSTGTSCTSRRWPGSSTACATWSATRSSRRPPRGTRWPRPPRRCRSDGRAEELDEALLAASGRPARAGQGQEGPGRQPEAPSTPTSSRSTSRGVLSRLNALGVIYDPRAVPSSDLVRGRFVTCPTTWLTHVASSTGVSGRNYPLKLAENPMQMGSAITYARRYVLLSITGVNAPPRTRTTTATRRAARCGTVRAYQRHLRRGEPTDRACRDAANAYRKSHLAAISRAKTRLAREFWDRYHEILNEERKAEGLPPVYVAGAVA